MKKILITALALLSMTAVFAQGNKEQSESKNSLSINAGFSIPTDDVVNANSDNINSYAASGITAGIDFQHNVSKYFGINVLVRAYSFPVDENTSLNDVRDNPVAVYTMDSEPYVLGFLGLGATAEYGNALKGYVTPFIGYGAMRSPEITVREEVGVNFENETREFDSDLSLVYGANFGIKFNLTKNFFLGVNGEYVMSPSFEFEKKVNTQQNNDPAQVSINRYEKEFSTFSVSLRIGFNL
tara:strand:+ start:469 stop:1188 length:720 start_codon:yes stop_codon:yes gene_type:complete